MTPKKLTTITIETIEEYEIGRQEIIELLCKQFTLNKLYTDIKIQFKIPSGSDYSGEIVDIDKTNPIYVTVTYIDRKSE